MIYIFSLLKVLNLSCMTRVSNPWSMGYIRPAVDFNAAPMSISKPSITYRYYEKKEIKQLRYLLPYIDLIVYMYVCMTHINDRFIYLIYEPHRNSEKLFFLRRLCKIYLI